MSTTLALQSAATGVAPFTFGQAFKKGDIPSGQGVVCSGALTFQAIAKNAWPDGSLKFAVCSGTASLTANTPLTLTMSAGSPSSGTALTTANLKATGITAAIDCGSFGAVSWATTDWDSPASTWVSGAAMSSWVYRKPVGSDPSLVAWLEVRLYATGAVEVLPWIENGYLLVAGPTNKSATYTFTLGGTQRCSFALDLPHHCRTPLINDGKLAYWLGSDPGVTPAHDKAYLVSTELVPKYRGNLASNNSEVAALPSVYTPMGKISFEYDHGFGDMSATGYQPAIGLLPTHDVHYLTYSFANLHDTVIRNGYAGGQFGIHYRDETTNRPIRFSSYPTLCIRSGSGMKDSGSGATSTYTPAVSGTAPTYWDTSHCPSIGFLAYLLSGRFYLLEEAQFAATAIHLNVEDASRAGKVYASGFSGPQVVLAGPYTGSSGICSTEVQTRSSAWHFRSLTQALCITPDADPLQADFKTAVEHNCSWFHGVYSAGPSNPFGFIQSTWADVNFGSARGLPPWQQDFATAAWGYARAMGLPISSTAQGQMDAFHTWKCQSIVGRLSATNTDWWYVNPSPYAQACTTTIANNYFAALGATGPWFASWKAMYDATYASPPSWLSSTEGVCASEFYPETQPGQFHNMFPALAYAVRFGVNGAKAAYDRLMAASNISAVTAVMDNRPVWSVIPTFIPSGAPMGQSLLIDNVEPFSNFLTIGNTGYGPLGSVVRANTATGGNPSGSAGAGPGYNDWDDSSDDGKEFNWVVLTLPGSGTLQAFEDGSRILLNPADGAQSWTEQLQVDGVNVGSPVTITVQVGAAASSSFGGNLQLGNDSFAGGFQSVAPGTSLFGGNYQLGNDTFAGGFSVQAPSLFSGNLQLGNDSFSGGFTSSTSILPNPLCAARIVKVPADQPIGAYPLAVPRFQKDPDEALDYGFDMSAVLAQLDGDSVQGFAIYGSSLLTVLAQGSPATGIYGALVAGGYDGATAELTCHLSMASGRVIESSIELVIRQK